MSEAVQRDRSPEQQAPVKATTALAKMGKIQISRSRAGEVLVVARDAGETR